MDKNRLTPAARVHGQGRGILGCEARVADLKMNCAGSPPGWRDHESHRHTHNAVEFRCTVDDVDGKQRLRIYHDNYSEQQGASNDPAAFLKDRRPVVAATGALGPGRRPEFRHVQVKNDKIVSFQRGYVSAYWTDIPITAPLQAVELALRSTEAGADESDAVRRALLIAARVRPKSEGGRLKLEETPNLLSSDETFRAFVHTELIVDLVEEHAQATARASAAGPVFAFLDDWGYQDQFKPVEMDAAADTIADQLQDKNGWLAVRAYNYTLSCLPPVSESTIHGTIVKT